MKSANLRGLLLSAGAISIAATGAAQIAGKLVLGAYKPEAAKVEHAAFNWELENGFKEVRPDRIDARRELVAVLLGDGAPLPGTDRVEIAFSGGGLLPSTVAVRAGATVLIRNDDEIAHELYAVGLDGFSAEATSPRARRSVNLTAAGHWPLRDKLVSHVSGQLHVFPNLIAAAAPDAEGAFSFKAPPGKYVLKVLHGERELLSKDVEMTSDKLELEPITLTDSPESK